MISGKTLADEFFKLAKLHSTDVERAEIYGKIARALLMLLFFNLKSFERVDSLLNTPISSFSF